ncbi:MAG: DUF2147 domain-containing protein [Rhodobacteraceae bacterium]|nr:DUF2147 domain-containing protein [Paracoccaceae bacterium]
MKIKASLLLVLLAAASGVHAQTLGTYLRDGTEPVRVFIENNQLFCTRISDGFEICNGMESQGNNTWQGDKLKNPDGPRWISAKGTIIISDSEMALEGCMVGGTICKSMTWPAQTE